MSKRWLNGLHALLPVVLVFCAGAAQGEIPPS